MNIKEALAETDFIVFEIWCDLRRLCEQHGHPIIQERNRQRLWECWNRLRDSITELEKKE